MDRETLSHYGWIVICVMILAVLLAMATPFGSFVSTAIQSSTAGLFDVNRNALEAAGISINNQGFDGLTPCAYKIIDGAGQTVSGQADASFRSDADVKKFDSILVDGNVVDEANYVITEGSTIVTFNKDYLETLKGGTHELAVVSIDGEATCDFHVLYQYYSNVELAFADINNNTINASADMDKEGAVACIYTDANGKNYVMLLNDTTFNDGLVLGDMIIAGGTAEDPIDVTVNGTVTVASTIRMNPDCISNARFNGANGAKFIRANTFAGQMFYTEATESNFHNLEFNNITLDGGAVWTGDVDKTLNRGKTNSGVQSSGSVLYLLYTNATLNNSTLQNHDDAVGEKGNAVFLRYYSTIDFNNSIVRNNNSNSTYYRGGVVTIRNGGTVRTNNADIYGNSSPSGGFMGISASKAYGGIAIARNTKFHNNYADNGAVFLMQCNSNIGYLDIDGCEFYNNASKTAVLTEWAYSRPFIIKNCTFRDNECAVWDCHTDPVSLLVSGKMVVTEDADYSNYLFEIPFTLNGALTDGSSIALSEASITKLMEKGFIATGTEDYEVTTSDLAKFRLPAGYTLTLIDVNADGILDVTAVKG